MVERFICTEKVKGSTPLISIYGGVMKLVYMIGLGPIASRRESSSLSTLIMKKLVHNKVFKKKDIKKKFVVFKLLNKDYQFVGTFNSEKDIEYYIKSLCHKLFHFDRNCFYIKCSEGGLFLIHQKYSDVPNSEYDYK